MAKVLNVCGGRCVRRRYAGLSTPHAMHPRTWGIGVVFDGPTMQKLLFIKAEANHE